MVNVLKFLRALINCFRLEVSTVPFRTESLVLDGYISGEAWTSAGVSDLPSETLALLIHSRCVDREVIRVLDVGGAFGHHLLNLSKAFPESEFLWTIVEHETLLVSLETMPVEENSDFAKPSWISWAQFQSCKLDGNTTIYSNSGIQYFPNFDEQIQVLFDSRVSELFFERIPVSISFDKIFVKQKFVTAKGFVKLLKFLVNMPDYTTNFTCISPQIWHQIAKRNGYSLVIREEHNEIFHNFSAKIGCVSLHFIRS